jgi:hypothetical protein
MTLKKIATGRLFHIVNFILSASHSADIRPLLLVFSANVCVCEGNTIGCELYHAKIAVVY